MNILRTLSLVAVLAVSAGGAATAQRVDAPQSLVAGSVGHWLYDQNGATIGSVRSLSGDGRTANIMIGSYFQQGSHLAQVPVSALVIIDGKTTIQGTTMQALNVPIR